MDIDRLFAGPEFPVRFGARHHALRTALIDTAIESFDFLIRAAAGEPTCDMCFAAGFEGQVETNGAIDAALTDGVATELAVFGIAPGAFSAADTFGADGPVIDAALVLVTGGKQKVHVVFVHHDAAGGGVVIGSVADGRSADGHIPVVEHANIARLVPQVFDHSFAEIDSVVEVNVETRMRSGKPINENGAVNSTNSLCD